MNESHEGCGEQKSDFGGTTSEKSDEQTDIVACCVQCQMAECTRVEVKTPDDFCGAFCTVERVGLFPRQSARMKQMKSNQMGYRLFSGVVFISCNCTFRLLNPIYYNGLLISGYDIHMYYNISFNGWQFGH